MPGMRLILKGPDLDPKYLCSSCHLLLDEPKQTTCGHRYCSTCVEDLTRHVGGVCRARHCMESITLQWVFPDKAIEREIGAIGVLCCNIYNGCQWDGTASQLKDHLQECDYENIACVHDGQGCMVKIQRKDLATHLQTACDYRPETCPDCNNSFNHIDFMHHLKNCPCASAKCNRCGKTGLTRAQLEAHQRPNAGDCPNIPTPNGRKDGVTVVSRQDQRARHPTFPEDDDDFTLTANEHLMNPLREASTSPQPTSEEGRVSSISHDENTRVERLQLQVENLVKEAKNLENLGTRVDTRMLAVEKGLSSSRRAVEELAVQRDRYKQQRRQDREIIETLEMKIGSLERIIALKDVALAEQDLRIQTLELTSYDGILTWKIPDFTRKRHDAITGTTTSFYSPCFFTSRTGYKMCARIYLNGDGMGKGTHVSLFFVVMRGRFDGLLRWPFRQKVTFMLLDQNNREHVVDAFRPDPTSSSFQRPTSDMNIASGCPLFVPLSQLESTRHAYVRDDAIFFKIIVDTSELN